MEDLSTSFDQSFNVLFRPIINITDLFGLSHFLCQDQLPCFSLFHLHIGIMASIPTMQELMENFAKQLKVHIVKPSEFFGRPYGSSVMDKVEDLSMDDNEVKTIMEPVKGSSLQNCVLFIFIRNTSYSYIHLNVLWHALSDRDKDSFQNCLEESTHRPFHAFF